MFEDSSCDRCPAEWKYGQRVEGATSPRAFRRRFDVSGIADQLDGVRDGYRRNRRAGTADSIDGPRNQRCRDERARRVMDQHHIRLLARERLKPGMHRGLARRPADGRRLVRQFADGVLEYGSVVLV